MTLGTIIVILSLILIMLGMPIVWVLGSLSAFYVVFEGLPLGILAHKVASSAATYPMLAVPLFMFAGKIMNSSGITNRIFNFADNIVGHIPGGLGHVNVVASLIFAGMSGSPVADVAGLGEVEIKAMKERNYDMEFSTGITMASAVIGPILPPSIPMVLLGVMAELSITGLFLGGFIPAFVIAIFMMVYIYFYAKGKQYALSKRPTMGEFLKNSVKATPPMLTPFIIVGGMTLGIFSPTEAATVAVFYSLFLGSVVYRELTMKKFFELLKEVVVSTARLMIVIASALLFGWVLVIENVPQQTAEFLVTISDKPWVVLLIINVVLLILGAIIENIILLLILVPMLVPAMTQMGVDPIHFGVIMVFNIMVGQLTPPMGLSLYVAQDITGMSFDRVCRAVIPFYIPIVIALLVVTYVPWFVLFIPRLFGF
jgi:tripartite ATP-independent transporter DctM subunit